MEIILEKKVDIENQIAHIQPYTIDVQGKTIQIDFDLRLTVIDGKVLTAITGTDSAMCCSICKMNPKTLNIISNVDERFKPCSEEYLHHGISPLHAFTRVFDIL